MTSIVGSKIKELRKKMGLNQEEFGNFLGYSSDLISNIECGRKTITADFVIEISRKLNKPVEYFYGFTQPTVESPIIYRRGERVSDPKINRETDEKLGRFQELAKRLLSKKKS